MKLRFAKSSWHFKQFILNLNPMPRLKNKRKFINTWLILNSICTLHMYVWHFESVRSESDYQCLKNWKGTHWKGQSYMVEYFILPSWKILEYMNVCESCKAKEIRSILIMCVFCFNCNCKPEPQLCLLTLVCSGGVR